MKNYNKIVGKNIKEIRQNFGITQTKLAELMDKNLRTIQKYESGTISLSIFLLGYLSELFDVPIEDFFQYEEPTKTVFYVELDR